jgi:RNA polymerase sigma factor (sigma-70 family)
VVGLSDTERARRALIARVWGERRRALVGSAVKQFGLPLSDIEDLYQRAYFRAIASCRAESYGSVRDFLYTAIEYMAADRWQREIPREDPLELDADQLDELLSPDVESDGGLEGQLVEQEQRDQFRRQLNAIVRELDPRVQQVIWLIDLEELPPREVRKRTGLSERQIRRYSEIGHKQLRRLGLAYLAEAYGSFCEQIASDVQTVAFTAGRYPQEQRLLEPAVARIDAHNASCEECRRKVAQLRRDRPELYRRMQRDLAILLPVPASALAASAATAKRGMLQRMLETLTGARQHAEGLVVLC